MLEHVQAVVTRRLPDWVLLLVSGGFLMLFVELILADHTEGEQLVGVVASMVGFLLSLAGLRLSGRGALRVAALMLLLGLAGLAGVVSHAEARLEGNTLERERYETEAEAARERPGSAPPPLAPLSLSGLALLGAVGSTAQVNREKRA